MASTPEVEAVLAWAVREGATNVIRHSGAEPVHGAGARPAWPMAAVEVIDDGRRRSAGAPGHRGRSTADGNGTGNGLAGLGERARRSSDGRVAGRGGAGR